MTGCLNSMMAPLRVQISKQQQTHWLQRRLALTMHDACCAVGVSATVCWPPSHTHHKLIQGVVPGFTGSKQEAGLEHCQADSWRQSIKVFDLELCHGLSFVGKGGLVDVSVLALATAHKQKQKQEQQEQQPANAKV